MRNKFNLLKTTVLALATIGLVGLSANQLALAADKKCGDVQTSIIECGETDENSIIYLLKRAIYILYGVVGVLAVVMIIVAGTIYATAGDSEEKVKTAKTMIKNTIIGILLFMFMTMILEFLIPGGIF